MARRFVTLDVFTDEPLSGNPLAIVLDGADLSTEKMQSIAGEFNLSETVFVRPAEDPLHSANIRIFTPGIELPFAGHPTVGTAVALGIERGLDQIGQGIIVLEEQVGPVRCAVSFDQQSAFAEFDLPRGAEKVTHLPNVAGIAAALGIEPTEIGFENHEIGMYNGGVPYTCIPVRNLDVIGRTSLTAAEWVELNPVIDGKVPSAFVYCRDTIAHDSSFHARMFAPHEGIPEDPATGSAIAAFVGALVEYDQPTDGQHVYRIEQGLEMGRPSMIRLELEFESGAVTGGRIGGNACLISRGELHIE